MMQSNDSARILRAPDMLRRKLVGMNIIEAVGGRGFIVYGAETLIQRRETLFAGSNPRRLVNIGASSPLQEVHSIYQNAFRS